MGISFATAAHVIMYCTCVRIIGMFVRKPCRCIEHLRDRESTWNGWRELAVHNHDTLVHIFVCIKKQKRQSTRLGLTYCGSTVTVLTVVVVVVCCDVTATAATAMRCLGKYRKRVVRYLSGTGFQYRNAKYGIWYMPSLPKRNVQGGTSRHKDGGNERIIKDTVGY